MTSRRELRTPKRTRTPRVSLALVVVLALAGLLFTVNSQISTDRASRFEGGLAGLVAEETEVVRQLTAQVETLGAEVDRLTDQLDSSPAVPELRPGGAGRTPVTGPGVVVTLDDAPADAPVPAGVHPDDLVVHQQDLEAVVNALWAGGAEAMTIQGQRIVSTSAIRCVGNVLLLHGQVWSPPYEIAAIGDPQALRAALDTSPAVQLYRQWADAVGLGWAVQGPVNLDLPAHEGGTELRYAQVPADVDVFAGAPRAQEEKIEG